ncbi:hen1 methyltransferase isoform X4 [Choristoneura fumiferana]|uniref:hen1 methyltransferase isoform X4 n=1 Tax=Choristoneura fumiferana TaxID=7141 RepID=UPI003D15403D
MIIALQTLIFFRESVIAVLERWLPPLGPLFRQLLLTFSRSGLVIQDEETEEMVFAEYTDDGGVMFFPPVYAQRYAAVCDCLMDERWYEKLEKVVNMGRHHDMNFIKYLTEVPGIKQILGVDIDCTLSCTSDLLDFTFDNYGRRWEKPLRVTLYQGNAADPDYRLIGCDAVVAIEMIEYMKPHDLDRLVHNIFGFIKPWIAIFTTTNADFNIVFKSLEKSGLRRFDHYFEWTREQLHDWCGNIVSRYPGYTVACKGVGPGPPGTLHYGCCSQLVLFVSKDYQKQMELNVNSLALVANLPQPNQICDFESDWETPQLDVSSDNMLCGYTDVESSTELPYLEHCSCYGTVSPTDSMTTMHHDKASQCNLESELGKSFVMFDVEDLYEVMWPRNKSNGRVYDIGDVASSLNNTMFVVKKFSKTTQNLLDGEEMNYLVHTRGVMDEVSYLTKMLNFNCLTQGEEANIWNNINWGDNAPYWNQYYKIVAVYNYPYEVKSEDNLILDLISDEINRLLDTQDVDEYSVHVSKLEIPIEKLMETVKHVTEDVDRVIDLLEYNGYEIDGDVVICSRVVVDDVSASTHDEWPDNETYSDWDTTDVNSTISDGSNMPMDFDGRSLRRALDRKVKKLRAMLTHDEDITRELNQVVCRLLKIALSSSRGRQAPVHSKWLQCKLLDLLTLTEKAIVRRKNRFIERYPLNAIGYDTQDDTTTSEMVELCKIKADDTALRIVEKYRHLVQAPVSDNDIIDDNNECYGENGLRSEFSTTLSSISTKLPDSHGDQNTITDSEVAHENFMRESSILGDISCFPDFKVPSPGIYDDEHVNKRIQSWVNKDLVLYPDKAQDRMISSGDDHSSSKSRTKNSKTTKSHRKHKSVLMKNRNTLVNTEIGTFKLPKSNAYIKKSENKSKRDKVKNKTLLAKKATKIKTSYKNLVRKLSNKATACELMRNSVSNYKTNLVKPIEDTKDQTIMQLTAPKPIPDSIIELCQPGIRAQKHYQELNLNGEGSSVGAVAVEPSAIAATKESLLIGIITDDALETVAMRRTVGTDPGMDTELYEQELELTNVTSIMNDDACYEKAPFSTRIINSQTIFLHDINEPTTSKGLRHVSMDVQCGTDSFIPNYASLSGTTSLAAVPKMFTTGIRIGDSFCDVRADNTSDFGTSTYGTNNGAVISSRTKSNYIKIHDSDTQVGDSNVDTKSKNESDLEAISKYIYENQAKFLPEESQGVKIKQTDLQNSEVSDCYTIEHSKSCIDESIPKNMTSTEMLKPVSSHIKIEDSGSEFNGSFCSVPKSTLLAVRFSPELSNSRVTMPRFITSKSVRPKLSCGGVHLHSYMDPQISEDVVYQGEWQQYRPKTSIRNKPCNYTVLKNKKDVASKKINGVPKDKFDSKKKPDFKFGKQINRKPKVVPIQVHHAKVSKTKDSLNNKIPAKKIETTTSMKAKPPWKPVIKVSSRIGLSTNITRKMTSRSTTQPMRRAKSVPPDLKLKDGKLQEMLPLKKYIPSYLSRMPKRIPGQKLDKSKFGTKEGTLPATIKINKDIKEPISPPSKVQDIKAVLLKIPNEPRENVSYVVFRNEIENSNSRTVLGENTVSARPSDRGNSVKGTHNPGSPNSSTCSTPNSVATVRPAVWPKPFSSRRHSTPNNKANVPRSGSDNKISSKIKRFIKKTKVSKKESKKDIENKENVPESSANSRLKLKDVDRALSGGLVGTSNTVYRAQVLSGSHTPNKSSIKIPLLENSEDKNKPGDEKKDECNSQNSNMVLVLEPCQIKSNTQIPEVTPPFEEWIVGPNKPAEESNKNNILTAMKELIEESLDFIDNSDNFQNIDSKTVILTPNRSVTKSLNDTSISPSASFNTVVNNKSETFHSAVGTANDTAENIENTSVLSLPRSIGSTENTDLLSFKSVASISKFSDCFADNESYNDFNSISFDGNAFQDIYERKETILTQSEPGALAIQAFSGYSINTEPVAGDQPDYVNLIDSETGSAAYETARLATSEEVFVSGRSSESFASCVLDDDSVALHPQEHPVQPPELPMPFAVELDENSNEVGLAVGAGAGDGRGIHSDQSQDSSGRGTSLSSSASSSGAQSEAILIDPSAFIAHFEMMREPGNGPVVAPNITIPPEAANALDVPSTTHSHEYRSPRPVQRTLPGNSDVEADVSSTDTDVPSDY